MRSVGLLAAVVAVAHGAQHDVYYANLAPIGVSGVSGEVAVFVANHAGGSGLVARLRVAGLADATLKPNCTGTNGCGVHVHSGAATSDGPLSASSGCADAPAQGGHYYTGNTDPWTTKGYLASDAGLKPNAGKTLISFSVEQAAGDWVAFSVAGRPVVIHDQDGVRVACGMLSTTKATNVVRARRATCVRHCTPTALVSSCCDARAAMHTRARSLTRHVPIAATHCVPAIATLPPRTVGGELSRPRNGVARWRRGELRNFLPSPNGLKCSVLGRKARRAAVSAALKSH